MPGFQDLDTTRVQVRVLTWNIFHGRDFPPDPALYTKRSRLFRVTEKNATHAQVNRNLFGEFASVLSRSEWDIALLQECPPRWVRPLAEALAAETHSVKTSRNSLGPVRTLIARLNPDLIGANEGGANTILVRSGDRPELSIVERRGMELPGDGRHERRAMAFVRLESGLCVVNVHAANDLPELAQPQLEAAADTAVAWSEGAPIVLGGDFNLMPGRFPVFQRLFTKGFIDANLPNQIDHLLFRGLELVTPPTPWETERRELLVDDLLLRLSDHSPVEGVFATRQA
jgi:endonuclease/exonuclease/phosphatase family metal-dependent hydrolase